MVFFDTSAAVALFLEKDRNHEEAKTLVQKAIQKRQILLITDYIFDETITTMLARAGHSDAVKAGRFLLVSSIVKIIYLDTELKLRAWEYFKRHKDKNFSFTDCTSFVLMKEMGLRHYIAFDEHFSQVGFTIFE